MDTPEVLVTLGSVALIGAILWFFFGPRQAAATHLGQSGVQEIDIIVKGGYSPDRVEVQRGRPVRLNFSRQETTSCTEQVVFPDFNIIRELAYGETVAIEFTPDRAGEFPFHCAMNMVRGQLVVNES